MHLLYDADTLELWPPGDAQLLLPGIRPAAEPEASVVRRALDRPLATAPLVELARGRRSAIVLVACRTRRTGSAVFLPEIADALNAAGIPDESILVCSATGTHANWRDGDAELLAGPDCARRLRFAGHDCERDLADVGTTARGTRVRLARRYLDAELKIATGRVAYHYFAGFSGGRKAVLPGVAGFESILANHGLAVLKEGGVRLHPEARNGSLAANPVHLDMLEAAAFAPPDFTLSTALDAGDRIAAAFGGELEASHAAAVERVREADAPRVAAAADWLFVSPGRPHAQGNALQALKALVNNFRAVRPGGAIVFAAACAEGIPEWLRLGASVRDDGELEQAILAGKLRQPHNALWLREVRRHAHVIMLTRLAEGVVKDLGFEKADDLEGALRLAERRAGPARLSYVVPFGNTTVVRAPGAAVAEAA
jgi:nickel-dependent lactate racemase